MCLRNHECRVRSASLDACQAQEASKECIVGSLLQGRRDRDGQRDGPAGAPQGHHVSQVLILEGQQGTLADTCPQVPCHIVRLLECHLQQASMGMMTEAGLE